jgi:hypothetical protein
MNYNKSFYLTLPSDASMDKFPDNSPEEYTTKLKHPIMLKGRWEVALVEFQYPDTILNITEDALISVQHYDRLQEELGDGTDFRNFGGRDFDIRVPPGCYANAEELLDVIRKQVPDMRVHEMTNHRTEKLLRSAVESDHKIPAFTISMNGPKVEICIITPRIGVTFDNEHLQRMMGYSKKCVEGLGIHVAEKPLNLGLGNQSIFVYCDVADYSLVGDTATQFLRSVSIKGRNREIIAEKFDSPHYVPVLPSCFETVHVHLANDLGDSVEFGTGKTILKLHFRQT